MCFSYTQECKPWVMNNDVSYEYVLSCEAICCRLQTSGYYELVYNSWWWWHDIGHLFVVTQQHSVYAPLHYLTDCGSIIYSTQGEASLFLCSLLVYSEKGPGEKACLFPCSLSLHGVLWGGSGWEVGLFVLRGFSSGVLRRVNPRKTTSKPLNTLSSFHPWSPCLDSYH